MAFESSYWFFCSFQISKTRTWLFYVRGFFIPN